MIETWQHTWVWSRHRSKTAELGDWYLTDDEESRDPMICDWYPIHEEQCSRWMKWCKIIQRSQPATWQRSWFKNRHRSKSEARGFVSDTQWVMRWYYEIDTQFTRSQVVAGCNDRQSQPETCQRKSRHRVQENVCWEICIRHRVKGSVMLWEYNPMNGKRRSCLVQMKWIRRSSPATWHSSWFKSRHCAITVMLRDCYEWSCGAMRLISDLQWVTLPLGANVEKFEDLRHWRFNAVDQRVDTEEKTLMLEDLYPTPDEWFCDDMRLISESQGETFLHTAMIWRNLKISASNVTTQLIQESTPREKLQR